MRRVALGLVASLVPLGAPAGAAESGAVAYPGAGRPISRGELRTDLDARDVPLLRDLVQLETGQTLTADGIRQTLLNLQGSSLVTEVEVYTRPDGPATEVIVSAWSDVIIDSISFSGDFAFREDALEELLQVGENRPLSESQVVRSVYAIWDHHEENGYLEATVIPAVERDERRKRATIDFRVDSGSRALVGEITLSGDTGGVPADALLGAMESATGERYWPQRARDDSDRLRRLMLRRGYRTAQVERPVETYDWTTHRMDLDYEIAAGSPVEVTVVGADLETLRREGLLAFMGDQGYDPALVAFSEQKVRTWYQSQGHYRVRVGTEEEVTDELIRLTMPVEPGRRYRLTEVRLDGNETFEDSTLGRLMATSERHLFTPGSGRLVDAQLEEDLRNVRSYYALQGFGAARVGPSEVEERDGDRLVLTVPIEEGLRRRVGALEWRGVESLSREELESGLALEVGGPYHATLLDQTLDDVRSRYRDAGFENALVSSSVEWDPNGTVADVELVVLEGRRTVVRRVVVRGQQVTRPGVLRKTIDLEPGDPVSRSQLLELQRDLYALGVFTSVDVRLASGELLSGERDVIVQLDEGDRHRLSLGAGFDTEDGARALGGYSLGNLGGRAMSLHLDTVISQREELLRILVLQPAVGDRRFPVQYSLFKTREEEPQLAEALEGNLVVEQVGVQAEAKLPAGRWQVPLLYTYKRVDNNASGEVEEVFLDRENASVRISSVTFGAESDRRDSPIMPRRGGKTVVQTEYAFPVLGADENFVKLFAQQAQHLDLGSAGVVGASLRLGGIESLQDVEGGAAEGSSEECTTDEIPDFGVAISERFFAGGRTTHRAYRLDTLGIVGETLFFSRQESGESGTCRERAFTTGGKGLALVNIDYRYPFLPGFWATLFFDSGNVWSDWRDITLAEFKNGVGVGVGWDSPVGPLRLEIGWKLDREEFEDPYQVFLSFGTVF